LDGSPEAALSFVGNRYEMPWEHGFEASPDGFTGPVARAFGISGIPAVFLIDADGVVVAKNEELMGELLEKELAKLFATSSSSADDETSGGSVR
jgi:hypothetical protein